MPDQTSPKSGISLNDPTTRVLWDAINQIPKHILEEYLADGIIDEREIEEISDRLAGICRLHPTKLNITPKYHELIKRMVRQAVHHIQHQRKVGGAIESKLSAVNLSDIRSAMGSLLSKGNITLDVVHLSSATSEFSHGDSLPEPEPAKAEDGTQ